ncbi:MAG: hypothetical protein IJJ00_04105 [Erysipelotrichaceae bacterium]|nr:hypothetical protein [Erysipelotrichaceae bacterium]
MSYQKCLYCDRPINRYSLYHLFIEEDKLCLDCRRQLNMKRRSFRLDGMKIEYFYDYDSLFKTLLLQYKECYDEALKVIFLYRIDVYIRSRYLGYRVIYVPSSKDKLDKRGFDHLKEIFAYLGFKEIKGLKTRQDLIQEGKNYSERQKMIGNYCYEGDHVKKVLIIDDVCTSGASLKAVKKAMEGHCDVIRALVLAKS